MVKRQHDIRIAVSSLCGVSLLVCGALGCGGVSPAVGAGGASGQNGAGGRGGGDSMAACSADALPPPAPVAPDASASVQARAEAAQMGVLDRLFGQYLRGDIVVYHGTMRGHSSTTAPAGFPPIPEQDIAPGPALARLAAQPTWTGDWVPSPPPPTLTGQAAILMAHSLPAAQYMAFQQAESQPGTTEATGISDDNSDNLLSTTCTDCAPSFWARPASLALSLAAAGTVTIWEGNGQYFDVPVQTTATLDLTAVPPCSVTFQELVTLNGATGPNEFADSFGLSNFVLTGNEYVWHVQAAVLIASPSGHGRCDGQYVPYTIDLYVNASNLASYGVRNYVQMAPQQQCAV